jgi:Arc/MetJ-type ribon-helix-helix transcriptional regulator
MHRTAVRLPESHVEDLDALVERGMYPSRSEAIRAAVRQLLSEDEDEGKHTERREWAHHSGDKQ